MWKPNCYKSKDVTNNLIKTLGCTWEFFHTLELKLDRPLPEESHDGWRGIKLNSLDGERKCHRLIIVLVISLPLAMVYEDLLPMVRFLGSWSICHFWKESQNKPQLLDKKSCRCFKTQCCYKTKNKFIRPCVFPLFDLNSCFFLIAIFILACMYWSERWEGKYRVEGVTIRSQGRDDTDPGQVYMWIKGIYESYQLEPCVRREWD